MNKYEGLTLEEAQKKEKEEYSFIEESFQWISVKDRSPPSNGVLLCIGNDQEVLLLNYANGYTIELPYWVKYWIQLPSLPKQERNNE